MLMLQHALVISYVTQTPPKNTKITTGYESAACGTLFLKQGVKNVNLLYKSANGTVSN